MEVMGGIIFNWDNQNFPSQKRFAEVERRLDSGVFQHCSEEFEWMQHQPDSFQIYRVVRVLDCPDIERYACNKRKSRLHRQNPLVLAFLFRRSNGPAIPHILAVT
jgi:hypothetical protein